MWELCLSQTQGRCHESRMERDPRNSWQLLWFFLPLGIVAVYIAYLTLWSGLVVNGEFHHDAAYEKTVDAFAWVYLAGLIFFAFRARRTGSSVVALTIVGLLIGFFAIFMSTMIIDG